MASAGEMVSDEAGWGGRRRPFRDAASIWDSSSGSRGKGAVEQESACARF